MRSIFFFVSILLCANFSMAQKNKAVFIIIDGVPADVLENVETPVMDEIASEGAYTRATIGGEKGGYSESPTISAVGYNHLLTGVWSNKHNVWGNAIKEPDYYYWNIFRIVEKADPDYKTAIFSTWLDNRTKLVGDGLTEAGNIKIDYAFDGFENDEKAFPHDDERTFISKIDEHVSKEAANYIEEKGPDLSWVYLEFTDDMGHKYGDSPQMKDAVQKADVQVGRIWHAIKEREKEYGENWMILVTTDHGRNAKNGKGHGGQSERERTIWFVTNQQDLNARFKQQPAMVDVMPSILSFMKIEMPETVKEEIDGVPFLGPVSVSNFKAKKSGDEITLTWDALEKEGKADIFIAYTNNFKEGSNDIYEKAGSAKIAEGKYVFNTDSKNDFYKILMKAPHNWVNAWIVK